MNNYLLFTLALQLAKAVATEGLDKREAIEKLCFIAKNESSSVADLGMFVIECECVKDAATWYCANSFMQYCYLYDACERVIDEYLDGLDTSVPTYEAGSGTYFEQLFLPF